MRVIQGARSYFFNDQVDSAEFGRHRLDEYEQTLKLLLARGEELSPDRKFCSTGDLEILLDTMGNL